MRVIRRMALAGMIAALGAGTWFALEEGPTIVANAAAESVQVVEKAAADSVQVVEKAALETIISRKGLDAETQAVLMGQLGERYPRTAAALASWTPVTAGKIAALHEAYQELSEAERAAIAREIGNWQQALWKQHAGIRETWSTGGNAREIEVAKQALDLGNAERAAIDTSVARLWRDLSARHPQWAQRVAAIMSAD